MASGQDVRRKGGELGKIAARLEHEHAAVPVIVSGGDELLRHIERRLFHELRHAVGRPAGLAAADVAIAGFRRVGDDAEGHELAVLREGNRKVRRLLKFAHIANHMIRGSHDQGGLWIDLNGLERRERHGGCGIAAYRLEQYRLTVGFARRGSARRP